VPKEIKERWKELDGATKREIRRVLVKMIEHGGALPIYIDNRKYVVVSGRKIKMLKHRIEAILKQIETNPYLQKPPLWVVIELKKILEVIS
jgi:hypothetical protein